MNRKEAIREACRIVSLAYHSIGDYGQPSDGFCDLCPSLGRYRNSLIAMDYVRSAVVGQLKRDGYEIAEGFDKDTGEEVKSMIVYIAYYGFKYEGECVTGVYSTKEKAQAAVDEVKYGDYRGIWEYEIDGEEVESEQES